jgi:4-alpha-glucanotransferase
MADSAYPRLAGTMVPVFALRHAKDLGIGDTQAVIEAISFCAEHKLGLLQLLPINETGSDNSPYNAISSVALDPVYLSLTPERVPGLLPEVLTEIVSDSLRTELQTGSVQYQRVKQLKLKFYPMPMSNSKPWTLSRGPMRRMNSRPLSKATWAGYPGTPFSAPC